MADNAPPAEAGAPGVVRWCDEDDGEGERTRRLENCSVGGGLGEIGRTGPSKPMILVVPSFTSTLDFGLGLSTGGSYLGGGGGDLTRVISVDFSGGVPSPAEGGKVDVVGVREG